MTQFSQHQVGVRTVQASPVLHTVQASPAIITVQAFPAMVRQHAGNTGGHLTTRGRRLLALLALIPLVITMALSGQHQASATGTAPTSRQVVVHSGESLWDIAVRVDPKSDPRQTMWDIKLLNHMSDSRLDAGQALIVPIH